VSPPLFSFPRQLNDIGAASILVGDSHVHKKAASLGDSLPASETSPAFNRGFVIHSSTSTGELKEFKISRTEF
jgi:hypothetical protein